MARPDEFLLELLRARHLVVVAPRDLEHQVRVAELPCADHARDLLVGEAALERGQRAVEERAHLGLGERIHEADLLVNALDLDEALQVALRLLDEVRVDAVLRQEAAAPPLAEDEERHRHEGLQLCDLGLGERIARQELAEARVVVGAHVVLERFRRPVRHRIRGLAHRLHVGDVGLDHDNRRIDIRVLHRDRQRIPFGASGVHGAEEIDAIGERADFPEVGVGRRG